MKNDYNVFMKKILVIGTGPASLMSIYSILEDRKDLNITLVDSSKNFASRIKVSGNGRCNFFHNPINYEKYSSPIVAKKYMELFLKKSNEIFSKLGLISYSDDEGRMYPITDSSKTIVNIFLDFLNKHNIKIELEKEVLYLSKNNDVIECHFVDKIEYFDYVILATGGFSYLYDYNKKLEFYKKSKIPLSKLTPSLTPIKIKNMHNKFLNGKRFKVELSLYENKNLIFKEKGELLFKIDGISGIVTFNLSSYLARKHLSNYDNYIIKVDFLPNYSLDEINQILNNKNFTLRENLKHLFLEELVDVLLKEKNIPYKIKNFELKIDSLYDFKSSQVTSGGIEDKDINDDLSLKNNNLIFPCGEILDIDGVCGGYNIAFAFASGYQIGKNLLKRIK